MTDIAPFHELTFLVEHILFDEEGADAETHHRCNAVATAFRKSTIGFPAARQLAEQLGLVVGNRINAANGTPGAATEARAWEAAAGALLPIMKAERAAEIARLERNKREREEV